MYGMHLIKRALLLEVVWGVEKRRPGVQKRKPGVEKRKKDVEKRDCTLGHHTRDLLLGVL